MVLSSFLIRIVYFSVDITNCGRICRESAFGEALWGYSVLRDGLLCQQRQSGPGHPLLALWANSPCTQSAAGDTPNPGVSESRYDRYRQPPNPKNLRASDLCRVSIPTSAIALLKGSMHLFGFCPNVASIPWDGRQPDKVNCPKGKRGWPGPGLGEGSSRSDPRRICICVAESIKSYP